jgi:two-component sensor histidine kinase
MPDKHPREHERVAALHRLAILDTPREAEFDEVVVLAAKLCDAPICVINLIDADRQWFKAETGLGLRETPLDTSICAHVILAPGLTVIEDTRADERLACNPLVTAEPGLRFYAGSRLETPDGLPLGTLCVLDTRPRTLDPLACEALGVLSRQVMRQLELRRALREEVALRRQLEAAQAHGKVLLREVDHRVKNSLQLVSSLLRIQANQSSSDEVAMALEDAERRVAAIGQLHEALHHAEDVERIEISAFLSRIAGFLQAGLPDGVSLEIALSPRVMTPVAASALALIVNELVSNAGKHAFPDGAPGRIRLAGQPEGEAGAYCVTIEDDGVGFPPGTAGQGLGMHVIEAAARRLDATLRQDPAPRGARFTLLIPPEQQTPSEPTPLRRGPADPTQRHLPE